MDERGWEDLEKTKFGLAKFFEGGITMEELDTMPIARLDRAVLWAKEYNTAQEREARKAAARRR